MFDIKKESKSQQYVSALCSRPFINDVFQRLAKLRGTAKYPNIQVGTHFQGYKTIPIQKLFYKNLSYDWERDGRQLWKSHDVKELYCYQESCKLTKEYDNGLFNAFFQAYINHGDLMINPDDIWTAIMLYFNRYVNDHAEQLRNAFVSHEGKKKLVVLTNAESFYDWNQYFEKIIIAIKENTVKGVTEQLQCNFSGTTQFFKFFSTAIIMNSFIKYFEYMKLFAGCGIQNIHMGGTLEDWQNVAQKLSSLQQYDVNGSLKSYIKRLTPVLEEFIETYKGKANIEFWNNIYHERQFPDADMYDHPLVINGWLFRFFTLEDIIFEPSDFPMEQINVPITVMNLITGKEKNMNLIGGCKGISVNGSIYRPHYSFAIVEMNEKKKKKTYFDY